MTDDFSTADPNQPVSKEVAAMQEAEVRRLREARAKKLAAKQQAVPKAGQAATPKPEVIVPADASAAAKTSNQLARSVCGTIPLSAAAAELVRDDLALRAFIELLVENKLFVDAVRTLAHGLSPREAVWWACQCARKIEQPMTPAATAALAGAEHWTASPTDDNRRALDALASAAGFTHAAGCAALGGWCSGPLGPTNANAPPIDPRLAAKAVAGSVLLTVATFSPRQTSQKFQHMITLGFEVADGVNRWQAPPLDLHSIAASTVPKPAPSGALTTPTPAQSKKSFWGK